jgi:hypothetical protein
MNTKRLIVLAAALLVVFCALPALAANLTGTWTMDDKDPDGNPYTATYVLKQEGTVLTGIVTALDETSNISKGKVDGNKISFAVARSDANYTLEGALDGDEIKMTLKSDDPNFPIHEVTLKRSK